MVLFFVCSFSEKPYIICNCFTIETTFFFSLQIFDIMKRKVPKFRRKVQGVPGDCMLPGLGLTSADKQLLVKNVSFAWV